MQLPQSNVQASAPSPARPQLPTIAPLSIPSRPIPAQSRSAVEDAQPTYFPLRYRRVETPSVGPPPRALDIATKTLPSPRGTVKGSYAVDDRLSEDGRDAVMTRPSNLDWSMRLTEFYDSYGDMGSTDTDSYPPSQGLHSANPTLPPVPRLLPPPMSVYSGSTLSSRSRTTGGRPKPSRRGMSRVSSRFPQDAYYDEDEEGYISGEYSDEIPDIVSIRVKVSTVPLQLRPAKFCLFTFPR